MGGEISEEFMAEDGCPPDRCCDDCAQMYMARELRAYRESGALEVITEILATYGGEELQMWVGNPHNQTGSRLGFFLSASTIRAMLAARGQMEAIESGAVDESKAVE